MSKRLILGLFICMAACQMAVPAYLIYREESTLRHGKVFRFRAAPFDPADAFRGRYVALRLEAAQVKSPGAQTMVWKEPVFATIEVEPDGYARFSGVTRQRPEGKDFVHATVSYGGENKLRLNLPFTRYYLNERLAPEAETAYREHSRRETRDAYVTVRVLSGHAALEELYIAGVPVKEYLKNAAKEAKPDAANR